MRPGLVERLELEYIRHGTLTLIGAFDVVTGKVTYHLGPIRTEQDLVRKVIRLGNFRSLAHLRHRL
jgi:hypothetical protein